jgi:Fe2+ transport system protein FeoA
MKINSTAGKIRNTKRPLTSLNDGEKGRIVRICGGVTLHRDLMKMGLFVGRTIRIVAIDPEPTTGYMYLQISEGFRSLEKDIAANIHVDVA